MALKFTILFSNIVYRWREIGKSETGILANGKQFTAFRFKLLWRESAIKVQTDFT